MSTFEPEPETKPETGTPASEPDETPDIVGPARDPYEEEITDEEPVDDEPENPGTDVAGV